MKLITFGTIDFNPSSQGHSILFDKIKTKWKKLKISFSIWGELY
jgi:hypothetical protein